MKISPRLKRIFKFLNKEGKKDQDTPATCDQHLYSNFYFNISQNPNENHEVHQSCDATIKELTEENQESAEEEDRGSVAAIARM